MNLRRLAARAVAVGATAALSGGALVALTAGTADAATASNTYTCTVSMLDMTFDTTISLDGTLPMTAGPAGAPVGASALSLSGLASVPADVAGTLAGYGVSSAEADDFALGFGKGKIPVPLSGDIVAGEGGVAWEAMGASKAFTTPDAGVAAVTMPKAFTFTAISSVAGPVPVPCSMKTGETPASLGSVTLAKQATTTSAKATRARAGKPGSLPVVVSGKLGKPADGKVVVKKGAKVIGKGNVRNGRATVRLAKLAKGRYKLSVAYLGNGSFKPSKGATTLTVR